MKQLAYLSTAVKLMNDDDLLEILKVSRHNNKEHNITGVLLYSEGTFIQVLEGKTADVDKIYESIERDSRHRNIIKMVYSSLNERYFPDWAMGFATIDIDRAREIAGFLNSTDELVNGDDKNTLVNILKTFISANKLVIQN